VTSGRLSAPAIRGWWRALLVCGGVLVLDQVSKAIVRSSLSVGEHVQLILGFTLTNTPNSGLAFGIGSGKSFVLAVTVIALVLVLIWFALDPSRPGMWLAVGLLAGGALGNLADRVRMDAVTDFIDPPLWPTFNLADIAITLGALGLVLISLNPEQTHGDPERKPDAEPKPGSG
jgi:signal peptidase II